MLVATLDSALLALVLSIKNFDLSVGAAEI